MSLDSKIYLRVSSSLREGGVYPVIFHKDFISERNGILLGGMEPEPGDEGWKLRGWSKNTAAILFLDHVFHSVREGKRGMGDGGRLIMSSIDAGGRYYMNASSFLPYLGSVRLSRYLCVESCQRCVSSSLRIAPMLIEVWALVCMYVLDRAEALIVTDRNWSLEIVEGTMDSPYISIQRVPNFLPLRSNNHIFRASSVQEFMKIFIEIEK